MNEPKQLMHVPRKYQEKYENNLCIRKSRTVSSGTVTLLLAISLLLVNCRDYSIEKSDARKISDQGEWIVKSTDYDEAPFDGTTGIAPCSVQCVDDESIRSGLNIEVGKNTGKEFERFCVHPTHPQHLEFAKLRRAERIRLIYVEAPLQEKCINGAMFLKLLK